MAKKHEDKYTVEQLAAMSPEQVSQIPPEDLSALKPEQLAALSDQQRSSLTAEQKEALSKKQTKVLEEAGKNPGNPENVNLAPGYREDTSANQPLREKVPHYAAGAAPGANAWGAAHAVGEGKTDVRVPPENVTGLTDDSTKEGGSKPQLAKAAATSAAEPNRPPTPAEAGLPRPELKAGQAPLPEEDPTPSTVPIPPPGPRRTA